MPALPHPQHLPYQVFGVHERVVRITVGREKYTKDWGMKSTHDKIAVGKSGDIVCVGDPNHDYRQIHHAGLIVSWLIQNFLLHL